MSDYYTWIGFCDAVKVLLGTDADRMGLEVVTPAWIRQGVIQVQQKIPYFRHGHETVYQPFDFALEGDASRGVKPPESHVREMKLTRYSTDATTGERTATHHSLAPMDWSDRFLLIHGKVPVNDGAGRYCIDPNGYTFYAYPEVGEDTALSIYWDGMKLSFNDDDQVPFTEECAGVVAEFVKAKIARDVERDIALHDSCMKTFGIQLAQLFLSAKTMGGAIQ